MKKKLALAVAVASLALCLIAPMLTLAGRLGDGAMKTVFLLSTVVWFVAASLSAYEK